MIIKDAAIIIFNIIVHIAILVASSELCKALRDISKFFFCRSSRFISERASTHTKHRL